MLLLELLKENWEHGRHVESERLNFTSIYVAIVGGILAFIGENFNLKEMHAIFAFLLIFSILGFKLCKKWGSVFDSHMKKVKEITMDLSTEDFDGLKYIEIQKYKPNEKIFKTWGRTKNLFNIFYIIMIIGWWIFLILSIIKNI